MEPVTATIVAALVSAAVAATEEIATTAIKDAYGALKKLVLQKCEAATHAVENIETAPSDELEQAVLAKRLQDGGIGADEQLQEMAQKLLDAIAELRGNPKAESLFDFDELEVARDLKMTNIESVRQVMRARKAKIGQDFIVDNVRDGSKDIDDPKA